MTEQELHKRIHQCLQNGEIKTIHQRTIRAMAAILRGEKWRDVAIKHEVSMAGISKAFKRIGVSRSVDL